MSIHVACWTTKTEQYIVENIAMAFSYARRKQIKAIQNNVEVYSGSDYNCITENIKSVASRRYVVG